MATMVNTLLNADLLDRVAQPVGALIQRSPTTQKLLLLAGAGAVYAGGIGFLLMAFRALALL